MAPRSPVHESLRPSSKSAANRFSARTLKSIDGDHYLHIRAGVEHRFIGIWGVVVEGRVFVRSWSLKKQGWYHTFLKDPRGAIQISGRETPVRARRVRGERLLRLIDHAYLEKFSTRGSLKYARDLCRARSKGTTTELVPA
jgi:hypothetical protein